MPAIVAGRRCGRNTRQRGRQSAGDRMSSPDDPSPASNAAAARSEVALAVIAGSCVLAFLYVAQVVLVPIALAVILSLAIAPLVRLLRRLRLGQVGAVLVAAGTLSAGALVVAAVIAVQLAHAAAELPRYEAALLAKVRSIRARVDEQLVLPGRKDGTSREAATAAPAPDAADAFMASLPAGNAPSIVSNPLRVLWAPVRMAGITLVVLLFVMLEHEAMRDRFIRLAGVTDLRATTSAINDAGERLSRFLISQFAVNFSVGCVSGIGLALLGFPHATLWAVLTMLLRFVPYVGFITAALSAVLLGAAVEPGWSLALMTLGLYIVIDLVAAQVVEPYLYGHMTGMSPLSVVVAALFWGWIWGPVGLVVSTPITLCLVVAGHHVLSLGFVNILLGDAPGLTLPQRFYQRALSGDSHEIIESARDFLKRRSLAAYCDTVLIPALRLTRHDLASGQLTGDQRQKVRVTAVEVVDTFGTGTGRRLRRRHKRNSVLDDPSPGRHLRHLREQELGQWQGRFDVAAGSIVICIGLGSVGDDLATEILVRILRDLQLDARHLSIEDVSGPLPEGASSSLVSMVCIVSFSTARDVENRGDALADTVRASLGDPCVVALLLDDEALGGASGTAAAPFDRVAHSIEETAQLAIARVKATRLAA